MKHFLNILFLIVLFSPLSLIHAQVPCGDIIAPEDIYDENSPLISKEIIDCSDPFQETTTETTPYTLYVGMDTIQEGGTVEVPIGGTNEYRLQGRSLLSSVHHLFYLHDGNDYRYINTQELSITESDYRSFASDFFSDDTDNELYIEAAMIRDDDTYDEEFRNTLYSFVDYVDSNFVPSRPKLAAGTYTLVSKEYLLILSKQNLFQKALALVMPSAHAEEPEYPENRFTLTFTIVEAPAVEECCSSVVFLPGIKGSVLKKNRFLATEDTLWPPTIYSDDVGQLALTNAGESIEDVFVDGVLDVFPVGPLQVPVYSPFSQFMDSLVVSETIAEWKPLPYDWRLLPETILEDGVKTRDGVVDIIDQIETLASSSKTGQVTIVAHSMGGLMGKAIIKKLEEEGKDDLIDSFVMVGSPQLGTPQAIASLLHGDGEGIPGDLENLASILNNSVVAPMAAREMGNNMPSAYNLLPAERYFEEVSDPVIVFDEDAAFTSTWRIYWGLTINTYTKFSQFLKGTGVTRVNPASNQLFVPEILNSTLVAEVKDFHREYDFYEFPEHIRVVEVAGWGRPTIKGVLYTNEHNKQDYNPIFTIEGDKTVTYPSAISSNTDEKYFFNLLDYNKIFTTELEHKDLLSVAPTQKIIESIVSEELMSDIDFITTNKPSVTEAGDQLLVSSHSPVVLGVSDSYGNFTGINSVEKTISEEIPGSSLRIFGQGQYIFLPKTGTYNFVYKGTGNGPTTIRVDKFSDDVTSPIVSYTDIPTVLGTVAKFEINSSAPENTQIKLDKNGDGVVDSVVKADKNEQTLPELVALLKTTTNALNLQKQLKQSLLAKVLLLEQVITIKNKTLLKLGVHLNAGLIKLEVEVLKKSKKITAQDATKISDLLNKIKEKV